MSHLSLIELLCFHWLCNAICMSHLMLRIIFSFYKLILNLHLVWIDSSKLIVLDLYFQYGLPQSVLEAL